MEVASTGETWLHNVVDGKTTRYNSFEEAKAVAVREDLAVEKVEFTIMPEHVRSGSSSVFAARAQEAAAIAKRFGVDASVFGGNHVSSAGIASEVQVHTIHGGITSGLNP